MFTEDALTETYGIRIEVTTDPLTGLVTTRPVGRHQIRALSEHTPSDSRERPS